MGEIKEGKFVFVAIDGKEGTVNNMKLPENYQPKNFSSMISIGESEYFISGGINIALNNISPDCFIFNMKKCSVQKIEKMFQARYTHSSLYYEGWVYVFGGRYFGDDDSAILNQCEKYSLS